ncbi:ABC transporter ATP-binding protein [Glycomyces algeriensis]|uniref:ABC transporter n=1 Tax=Glycomyces algeriensis TaxID=256037 RepID=A0A9W6LF08_9ACTN|nr:ABC transporter ATP-binding protein [Glycomyces algeriensis]MDA1367718.1 ABC transporter ATP-binding protein [Glycomyces algeriensis]MDR7352918.1 simple sugar transport system ATP-binding protein [Glycomyces algeriensis]GLI40605.1 ABC transporter [Glycomyces algeriensis]
MRLELKGLTKKFGSFTADDDIDLVVEPGQIHAVLGENGAGKSTLMNMLYGILTPTSGEILIDGEPVAFGGPGDAIAAGIGMVHQHFKLVGPFSVADNVQLGREHATAGVLSAKAARKAVLDVSEEYGLKLDPDAICEDLPVGVQQRVEIVKALSGPKTQLLILDEPTAVLTPAEITELLQIMRNLAAAGTSILFISHKLKEVQAVADTITVIRRGKVVAELEPTASEAEMASAMVGRAVTLQVDKSPAEPGEARLEVQDLTVVSDAGVKVVDGLGLTVRSGEIVGLAGVEGNGQTELARSILGLIKPDSGTIAIDGKDVHGTSPAARIHDGLGYIPEDRGRDGVISEFSVAENLVLNQYRNAPFSKRGAVNASAVRKQAADSIAEFDIRTQSPDEPVSSLSGGNAQKVIIAREFSRPRRFLVAAQPTRGVDVGATEFIHSRLVAERDTGTGVLLISSELDEIYALADRIAVIYNGRIVGEVAPDTPREVIGRLMVGADIAPVQEPAPVEDDAGESSTDEPSAAADDAAANDEEANGGDR